MRLNYRNTILVGLAFLTISAFWELYDWHVPLILENTFKMEEANTGIIMALDNIVALLLLPLLGRLSDRTATRIGRRKPYIIFGTVAAVIIMMAIPFAAHAQSLVFFMIALGFLLIAMASYRSPAVALMPDVTPKPLRSKGNAVINLMGAVGGGLFLLLNTFLAPDSTKPEMANYWPIFMSIAGIMVLGTLIVSFIVNEPRLVRKMREESAEAGIDPEEAKDAAKPGQLNLKLTGGVRKSMLLILGSIFLWFMGYNAVTTGFSRYAVNYLGMEKGDASPVKLIAIVAATIAFIPIGIISSRVGRKKSIMFGIILLAAVFGTATLYTEYSPLMYVTFALAGVGWASINVNSLPMVLEMSKGANLGKYTGYYYSASMAAQILTPYLSGLLLQHVGYVTLLPYGAIFIALAFFTMWFVKHGDSKPIKQGKLEALGASD